METYQQFSARNQVDIGALGDPSRRAIFELIAQAPRSVGEIAREFPISRPAVSQHLRILKASGLVIDRADGNRRIYQLNPSGMEALKSYFDSFWTKAITAYKESVEEFEEEK